MVWGKMDVRCLFEDLKKLVTFVFVNEGTLNISGNKTQLVCCIGTTYSSQ